MKHLTAAVLAIFVAFPALAVEFAVQLRIDSADSLEHELAGFGAGDSDWLEQALAGLGISDASWFDRSEPAAVGVTLDGLAVAQQAGVWALPVRGDAAEVAAKITEAHENLDVRAVSGYVLVSGIRGRVESVEPRQLIDPIPGMTYPVALDVDLQAVAPMALMGLEAGRVMMQNEAAEAADMSELMDVYFRLLKDVVANTQRFQIGIEVRDDHLVFRNRYVPVAGSTLEGLIAAQKSGFPRFARYLDPGEATAVVAGNLQPTEAFAAAMVEYGEQFAAAFGDTFAGYLNGLGESIDEVLACSFGEIAMTMDFSAEDGATVEGFREVSSPEACRSLMQKVGALQLSGSAETGVQLDISVSSEEKALQYRGVEASRVTTEIVLPDSAVSEIESDLLELYAKGQVTYMGVTGKTLVSAGGVGAEDRFRTLVDRVKDRRKVKDSIGEETFAPLGGLPGIYTRYDLGKLVAAVSGDEDEDEDAATSFPPSLANTVLVYSFVFDSDAATIEIAVPASAFADED